MRAHSTRGTHVTGGTIGGWSRKKRDLACRNLRVDTWKGEEIHSSGRERSQRTLFATPRPTPAASIKAESRSPNPPRPRLLCLSPLFLPRAFQRTPSNSSNMACNDRDFSLLDFLSSRILYYIIIYHSKFLFFSFLFNSYYFSLLVTSQWISR